MDPIYNIESFRNPKNSKLNVKKQAHYQPFLADKYEDDDKGSKQGLKSLMNSKVPIRSSEIIEAYCSDLKWILDVDNLSNIVEKVFEVESGLEQLALQWEFSEGVALPKISDLYQTIGPLFLRTLMESEGGSSQISKKLIEALRVSIEDELFRWKEFLLDNQL